MVIETTDELLAWVESNAVRHRAESPTRCLCGWLEADNDRSLEDHLRYDLVNDLGNVLASNMASDPQESWADTLTWASGCIEQHHDSADALIGALRDIADVDDPIPNPRAYAAAVLLKMYPDSTFADEVRALALTVDEAEVEHVPSPQDEPADEVGQ